jgi:hypothetical protein
MRLPNIIRKTTSPEARIEYLCRKVQTSILINLSLSYFFRIIAACSLWLAASGLYSQSYDTISNWDGISRPWHTSTPGAAIVLNSFPDSVNESAHCFKFITGEGPWDYMYTDLDAPVNFDVNPRYKIKVLSPSSGGHITLKFENFNNTYSQEIMLTRSRGSGPTLNTISPACLIMNL